MILHNRTISLQKWGRMPLGNKFDMCFQMHLLIGGIVDDILKENFSLNGNLIFYLDTFISVENIAIYWQIIHDNLITVLKPDFGVGV